MKCKALKRRRTPAQGSFASLRGYDNKRLAREPYDFLNQNQEEGNGSRHQDDGTTTQRQRAAIGLCLV